MKKLFLGLLLLAITSLGANAQLSKINQLFDKYQDVEGITSIKIGKPMFRMLNNLKLDDEDMDKIKPLLSAINSIQILIFQDEKDKKDSTGATIKNKIDQTFIKNEMFNAVKNLHYDELMSVNTKGQKIKFLSNNANADILNNLVLSINSDTQNILMLLDGKISMNDISKLASEEK